MKKIIYILLFLPILVLGQSTNQNYVKTKVYKIPTSTTIPSPTVTQANQTVTYFDGLGRPIQKVNYQQSNSGKDIIENNVYDAFGRQPKDFLPYVNTVSSLNFDPSADTNQLSYYSSGTVTNTGNPNFEQTNNPYRETIFEASPLNRVLEQASTGNSWEKSLNHTVKLGYEFNTVADNVKMYKVVAAWNTTTKIYDTPITDGGVYAANKLYKNIIKNENWTATSGNNNTTQEFKNNEGQVLLKRVFGVSMIGGVATNTTHDTYYIYDQFGMLSYTIPPLVNTSITLTTTVLNNLCYQYKYDTRNRLAEKRIPGKNNWDYFVYDKIDRLVATGPTFAPFSDLITLPPALPKLGWIINKYDALNRIVCSGWQESLSTLTFNSNLRTSRQTVQNGLTTTINETKTTTGTIDSISAFYTNLVAPTTYKLLNVNYYDNYTFPNAPATIPATVLTNASQAVYYNNTLKPQGLPTGSWTRALQTSTEINGETSYLLYDNKANVVRVNTKNFLTGYTQTDSKIDFIGKTLYTETTHKRLQANATEIYVRDDYSYSNQERLTTHTHKIGLSGTPQLMSKNTYDELGQLIAKSIGGTDLTGANPLQKVNYNYNSRGWLKGINNIDNLNQGTDPKDLFAFKINYNTVENIGTYIGKALYNGNISETFWRTSSDNIKRKYGYFYDDLNRLNSAVYMKPEASTPVINCYNESQNYDKNGNILALTRYGNYDGSNTINLLKIDDLDYNYVSGTNKLNKVYDASNSPIGFTDNAGATPADVNDYAYDDNGNMTLDKNKGITSIKYNYLNLPTEIIFNNNPNTKITYIYNANGSKLQKFVRRAAAGVGSTTDYMDGFQYLNANLQFFPTSEGYVNNTIIGSANNFNYVFNYKDHLGNIRLSYALDPTTQVLTILEENHYYPFGLKHTNYNSDLNAFKQASTTTTVQLKAVPIVGGGGTPTVVPPLPFKYMFQEQERQDELALNWDNFKYRNYDFTIGRFMNVDPLTEKYHHWSPYVFGGNQVVHSRELEGLEPENDLGGDERQSYNSDNHGVGFGNSMTDSNHYLDAFPMGGVLPEVGVESKNIGSSGMEKPDLDNDSYDRSESSNSWSDLWNSFTVRSLIPDRIFINLSYNANPYIGTSTDFSLNWITRGNDASIIPYSITSVAGTVGMMNGGIGVGAGGGYYPTTDMRTLPTGMASNAMLGWSFTGTAFGAADGGRVSLTGTVGLNNTPFNSTSITWMTGGTSVGFGTPGTGVYGGVSYSTPSFGTKKEF
jgi:RHS repeat-associated protein